MAKQQTKELLLAKGAEIMHHKGFNDSGIQEVLEATGVPKGSFYYYFKSKEDFGLQVIDLYAGVMLGTFQANMAKTELSIVERMRGFFKEMTGHAVANAFTGCPVGNLSQEMGSINEAFGRKLDEIFAQLEADLAECIRDGQAAGEIDERVDPEQAAVFLVSSWEGALLRMKLTRDTVPFDIFDEMAIGNLLRGA